MSLFAKLRSALDARAETAAEAYWKLVASISSDKIGEDSAARVESVLRAAGKTLDHLEADVEKLTELRAKVASESEQQLATKELARLQRAVTEADERSLAAIAEAKRRAQQAADDLNRQMSRMQALREDVRRCEQLRSDLAAAGMPAGLMG